MSVRLEMKADKRNRYVGMSTSSDTQYEDFLAGPARHPLDILQVDCSIGNRRAAGCILPFVADAGTGVLVDIPALLQATASASRLPSRTSSTWAATR